MRSRTRENNDCLLDEWPDTGNEVSPESFATMSSIKKTRSSTKVRLIRCPLFCIFRGFNHTNCISLISFTFLEWRYPCMRSSPKIHLYFIRCPLFCIFSGLNHPHCINIFYVSGVNWYSFMRSYIHDFVFVCIPVFYWPGSGDLLREIRGSSKYLKWKDAWPVRPTRTYTDKKDNKIFLIY